MKFSIIVPCYNQAHYLFGLLDNLATATDAAHEVIIINDGSTKSRTREIIDRLEPAGAHQTIIRIHQNNIGLASTRNVGLDRATGDFVQFLDADDMLVPGKLDRQARLIESQKVDLAIDEYMLGDDNLCEFWPSTDIVSEYELSFSTIAEKWERGVSVPIHCPLFKRSVLSQIRFVEGMRAKEDWLFWMMLFRRPRKYIFTKCVGAIYRVHGASMTRADNTGNAYNWLKAVDAASRLMPEKFDAVAKDLAIQHFVSFYCRFFYEVTGNFNEVLFTPFLRNLTRGAE